MSPAGAIRWVWRWIVVAIGAVLLLLGVVLLVTPGPGLLLIAAGLGILATRFAWARTVLERVRERISRGRRGTKSPGARDPGAGPD
jgi:uncharacterized protein (TIGR02611 family)